MGFFDKLFSGLSKTRNNLDELEELFQGYAPDSEDFYDELEELLVLSDVGVTTAEAVVKGMRKLTWERRFRKGNEAREGLIELLSKMLQTGESTLKMLAQSYIRDTVGIYNVDDVITTGKAVIQSEIKEKLTNRMIAEDIGLSVVNLTIQDAFPPTDEVLSAFKNVENAKQGKETAVNNANKDRNEKIPQAEAQCDKILKAAEAEKQARINEAEGQAARFEQMYAEYEKYPLITRQRMFYEAMEEVLPDLKVYVTDGGTQTLLPLDSFSAPAAAPEGGAAAPAGQ